jgi:hypothetical protein
MATNEAMLDDAIRCANRHGTARRKHRFVYCCVIAGTYFEVTALAWRKYATLYMIHESSAATRLQGVKSSVLQSNPWRSWLRNYATSRKIAGSVPDWIFSIYLIHPAAL